MSYIAEVQTDTTGKRLRCARYLSTGEPKDDGKTVEALGKAFGHITVPFLAGQPP